MLRSVTGPLTPPEAPPVQRPPAAPAAPARSEAAAAAQDPEPSPPPPAVRAASSFDPTEVAFGRDEVIRTAPPRPEASEEAPEAPRPELITPETLNARKTEFRERHTAIMGEVQVWVQEETARREAAAASGSPRSPERGPAPSAPPATLDNFSLATFDGPVYGPPAPREPEPIQELRAPAPGTRRPAPPRSFAPSPEEIAAEYDRRGGAALRYEVGAFTHDLEQQLLGATDERRSLFITDGEPDAAALAQNRTQIQDLSGAYTSWSRFLESSEGQGLESPAMRAQRTNNTAYIGQELRAVQNLTPMSATAAGPDRGRLSPSPPPEEPEGTRGFALNTDIIADESNGVWSTSGIVAGTVGYADSEGRGFTFSLGYSTTLAGSDPQSAFGANLSLFDARGAQGGVRYHSQRGLTLADPLRIPLGEVGGVRLGVAVSPYIASNDRQWGASGIRVDLISIPLN